MISRRVAPRSVELVARFAWPPHSLWRREGRGEEEMRVCRLRPQLTRLPTPAEEGGESSSSSLSSTRTSAGAGGRRGEPAGANGRREGAKGDLRRILWVV